MKIHASINRKGAEGYFAAANTRHGFYSLYNDVYSEEKLDRIYIIKGGPGTGKSTMMDSIALRASLEGHKADIYLCSSDPASIDGVVIPSLGVAVLDGTAPHVRDPLYPGIVGQTVDLGKFWNISVLKKAENEIKSYIKSKSTAYSRAYRYLAASGTAHEDLLNGLRNAFEQKKAETAIRRLFEKHRLTPRKEKGSIRRIFMGAISTSGTGHLNTLTNKSVLTYTLTAHYGAETLLMDLIRDMAIEHGISLTLALSPLSPEHIEAVFFEETGLLFTTASKETENENLVNVKRFIDRSCLAGIRAKLRISEKMKSILLDEAISSLCEAGEYHKKTESLYSSAMNFEAVGELTNEITNSIFKA